MPEEVNHAVIVPSLQSRPRQRLLTEWGITATQTQFLFICPGCLRKLNNPKSENEARGKTCDDKSCNWRKYLEFDPFV